MAETEAQNADLVKPAADDTGLVPPEPEQAPAVVPADQAIDRPRFRSGSLRKWIIRLGIPLAIILVVAFFVLRGQSPKQVSVVQPHMTTITETIASSGRVGGVTETLVGAQAQGVVDQLFVREGDRVTSGQRLATLKNNVAEAQVSQSEQAVRTAQAQLSQTARGPLASEVQAASAQVSQAEAQVTQQRAAVTQARRSVTQAQAQLHQLQAESDLASKELERSRTLVQQGVIPRSEYDQTQTNQRVAAERVSAQQQAIRYSQANVRQAQAGLTAAEANLRAQQASLRTIQSGARSEDVAVAQQRLREAQEAVRVARQQVENAVVTAPFEGVVTVINAQMGQTVGAQGVLTLVSGESVIRLDVDESNLADLRLGQNAILASSTFSGETFEGTVTEIGAAVDVSRGTIQVTVAPSNPPEWLRPGQTLNVNIVTANSIPRLLVPPTALTRVGDRTVVFVIEDGVALEKTVVTRAPTADGVPVLAGLTENDTIISDVTGITAGDAVRVKAQ